MTEVFSNAKGNKEIAPCSLRASQKVKRRSHSTHRVHVCILSAAAGKREENSRLLILQHLFLVFIPLCRSLAVCSLCKHSPLSLLALQTVQHKPDGTTDYSCRHTGPNSPETTQKKVVHHKRTAQPEEYR